MVNTILFDLDGTVLPMEFDLFMKLYFHTLGQHFKEYIEPEKLHKAVMASTDVMIKVNDGRSNEEKFMTHFESIIKGDMNLYKDMFNNYYDTGFGEVKASTSVSQEMIYAVKLLQEKGYKVVCATNPLFPLKANHHRIKWAGLDPSDFEYISCFEENNFCKPNKEYFDEVLDKIGKQPEECIMIGNDLRDDLGALKSGIETYIIKDHLVNRHNQKLDEKITFTYHTFKEFVTNLPKLN